MEKDFNKGNEAAPGEWAPLPGQASVSEKVKG